MTAFANFCARGRVYSYSQGASAPRGRRSGGSVYICPRIADARPGLRQRGPHPGCISAAGPAKPRPPRQARARPDRGRPGRCTLAGGALFKAGGRPPASRAGRPYFGEGMNEDEASDAPPCAVNYRPAAGRGLPGRGRTGRAAGCGRRSSHSRAVQHNAGSSRRTRRRFLVRHHAFACRGRDPSSRNRPAARSLVRGAAGLCRGGV